MARWTHGAPVRIGIAVFSGTGNTLFVAQQLAAELRRFGSSVTLLQIDADAVCAARDGDPSYRPETYDLFGIGHPVLGFGPTPLVEQFAGALPSGTARLFVFKSAADSHSINNTASDDLIATLTRKGYEVFHDFLYVMPCNFIVRYPRALSLQIVDTAIVRAREHARDLVSGVPSRLRPHRFWRVIARVMHTLESKYGRKQFGRALGATDGCTSCGRCVRNCPVQNITRDRDRVAFGNACLFCMRCVYDCPERAIAANGMSWCIIRGGYRLSDFINASDRHRTFITSRSRGYWKHLRRYFSVPW